MQAEKYLKVSNTWDHEIEDSARTIIDEVMYQCEPPNHRQRASDIDMYLAAKERKRPCCASKHGATVSWRWLNKIDSSTFSKRSEKSFLHSNQCSSQRVNIFSRASPTGSHEGVHRSRSSLIGLLGHLLRVFALQKLILTNELIDLREKRCFHFVLIRHGSTWFRVLLQKSKHAMSSAD